MCDTLGKSWSLQVPSLLFPLWHIIKLFRRGYLYAKQGISAAHYMTFRFTLVHSGG